MTDRLKAVLKAAAEGTEAQSAEARIDMHLLAARPEMRKLQATDNDRLLLAAGVVSWAADLVQTVLDGP